MEISKSFLVIVFLCLQSLVRLRLVDSSGYGFISATCTMEPLGFYSLGMNISGVIRLWQSVSGGNTTLTVELTGFVFPSNGTEHGFHIHETGDLSGNCTAAKAHYNPTDMKHGGPNDAIRHVGDLGNIIVDENDSVYATIVDNVISLQGNYSVLNRSIVVHVYEDDLGKGNSIYSNTTGNSGYRIGCCTIIEDSFSDVPISAAVDYMYGRPVGTLLLATLFRLLVLHFDKSN